LTICLIFDIFDKISFLDPITGMSSGTGFITFVDADSGKTAVRELDRFDLGGKRMRVNVLDDKKVPDVEPMSNLDDNMDGSVGRIALMNKLAQRTDIMAPKVRFFRKFRDLVSDYSENGIFVKN